MEHSKVMNFSQALMHCKEGENIQRQGWNGKGLWVELQEPYENSKMTLPYLYLNYPSNSTNTPNARVP